ncbi:MAG: hypothetical protein ACTSQF_00015 [Candidatus Heimdallarchaeaceae archaeon]
MNKVQLNVTSCTESSNGGFIVTLKTETEDGATVHIAGLGNVPKTGIRTYYIKTLEEQTVDAVIELDLDMFDIKERDYTPDDAEEGDAPMKLKWLYVK